MKFPIVRETILECKFSACTPDIVSQFTVESLAVLLFYVFTFFFSFLFFIKLHLRCRETIEQQYGIKPLFKSLLHEMFAGFVTSNVVSTASASPAAAYAASIVVVMVPLLVANAIKLRQRAKLGRAANRCVAEIKQSF